VPSCSPAVPPPPVCGAPFGIGVADGVGVAVCVGVAVWVAEGEGVELCVTLGATEEALADGLAGLETGEVVAGALRVRVADGLADLVVVPAPLPDEGFVLPAPPPVCGDGRPLAVPLYRPEGVGDTVPEDGEKIDGIDDDAPDVQADTDADMRTVTVAQPAAVSLALLTFMKPPYIPDMQ
jgi:hypothetical protein